MLDHIGFPVTDFARSKAFYTRALEPLGFKLIMEVNLSEDGEDGYAGFGSDRPHFWVGTGKPLAGRLHVAFAAKNRAEVQAF
ncbi:MAG: VOC family protein, partial [Hyphomicrobium sp.]|nr:VOC family protein [Hyphomicrobium sp.]